MPQRASFRHSTEVSSPSCSASCFCIWRSLVEASGAPTNNWRVRALKWLNPYWHRMGPIDYTQLQMQPSLVHGSMNMLPPCEASRLHCLCCSHARELNY